MARVFPERNRSRNSLVQIRPQTSARVPGPFKDITTSRKPTVKEKKNLFSNPKQEDYEYMGTVATPATVLDRINPFISEANVLEASRQVDPRMYMAVMFEQFNHEYCRKKTVPNFFWNVAREVIETQDPVALDLLHNILRMTQQRGLLFPPSIDGPTINGPMIQNIPSDLEENIHDLAMSDPFEDEDIKYHGPYYFKRHPKTNKLEKYQRNLDIDREQMASQDFRATKPNDSIRQMIREQADMAAEDTRKPMRNRNFKLEDISDDLSTNSGISVEPLSISYSEPLVQVQRPEGEFKSEDDEPTTRGSGLTRYPLLYSLYRTVGSRSKPHIRSKF
jgi:hypothetical protein